MAKDQRPVLTGFINILHISDLHIEEIFKGKLHPYLVGTASIDLS